MKKSFSLILASLLCGAMAIIACRARGADADEASKAPAAANVKEESQARVSRDNEGNAVVTLDDETAKAAGVVVTHPQPAALKPQLTAFGQVLDPSPLLASLTELATARAGAAVSSNELVRLKTLDAQGNTSARLLQSGEAAATRDQLAAQAIQERLVLAWGASIASHKDLPAFARELATQQTAIVRLNLNASQSLPAAPIGAMITTLAGKSGHADFLGLAMNIDPQTLGRGFLFFISSNSLPLLAGESVSGVIEMEGEPVTGVTIPRSAIVRTAGAPWIYLQTGGNAYTRRRVSLDYTRGDGWFLNERVTGTNNVVITGAQILLSEEQKGALQSD